LADNLNNIEDNSLEFSQSDPGVAAMPIASQIINSQSDIRVSPSLKNEYYRMTEPQFLKRSISPDFQISW
jgi:hypothetical protein